MEYDVKHWGKNYYVSSTNINLNSSQQKVHKQHEPNNINITFTFATPFHFELKKSKYSGYVMVRRGWLNCPSFAEFANIFKLYS
jgi:hypothetical protein